MGATVCICSEIVQAYILYIHIHIHIHKHNWDWNWNWNWIVHQTLRIVLLDTFCERVENPYPTSTAPILYL